MSPAPPPKGPSPLPIPKLPSGAEIQRPSRVEIRTTEPDEPPVSRRTERIKHVAAAFGWDAFFTGLAKLVGAIAAAGIVALPVIDKLKSPAPIDETHLKRIAEIEQELAESKAKRELIADWAVKINEHSSDELNDKRRIELLGEAVSCINGKPPIKDWPGCSEATWTQDLTKNKAQGHNTKRAW